MADGETAAGRVSPWMSTSDREQVRGRKRQAILVAAARVFTDRGYNNVSVDDIAKSLGVTKPTLYHYFRNKEEMVVACAQHGVDAIERSLDSIRVMSGPGLAKLQELLHAYAKYVQSDFGSVIVRLGGRDLSAANNHKVRQLKQRADQIFREFVAAGVADGSVVAPDVRVTAFALAGLMNSFGHWFRTSGELSGAQLIEHYLTLVTCGLAPRTAPTSDASGPPAARRRVNGAAPHGLRKRRAVDRGPS
jgi:AcrR family transcriptional regulator